MSDFTVRQYQQPFFSAWTGYGPGGKRVATKDRLIEIAHRRWGKDEVALRASFLKMMERPASYWHMLPEYAQARKALWTGINPHTGKRRILEAFPQEAIDGKPNEQEMFIRFKNGSTWQLVGSDNFNSLVGAGVAGVTFSEWALANPSAWGYIRPMVEENNGWAAFITTPRGNNHAKAMYDLAVSSDRWFAETSNVHDTGALTEEQIAEALEEYQALYGIDFGTALWEQEYLCSWSGAMLGAFFGAEMNRAEREGRVCAFEIDHTKPVHTVWDLGKAQNNPIWCFQVINNLPHIVDFWVPETEDLADWVQWLSDRGYHGNDYVPHDILVTEWGSSRTRFDLLRQMGRKPVRLPKVSVADGLQAGRSTINVARFRDTERVAAGIEGLKNYRREWDDERKTFRENPVKDWAEHIGSAWRYLGLAWREVKPEAKPPEKPKELVYTANPDGSVTANMSVMDIVQKRMKERKRRGN